MTEPAAILEPTTFADLLSILGPRMICELLKLLLEDLANVEHYLSGHQDPVEAYRRIHNLCGEAGTFGLIETTICSRRYLCALGDAAALRAAGDALRGAVQRAISVLQARLDVLSGAADSRA